MSKEKVSESTADQRTDFRAQLLEDYKLVCMSREASILGRKEVLTGKAKFGIFGDGKELAQLAMAKYFRKGDWRSGYYRDQTIMFALDLLNVQEYFAGLYAHTDELAEPMSAGRQMNGHFATATIDQNGEWKNLTEEYNISADISPTAGQMPRLLGLAQASSLYRQLEELKSFTEFSRNGDEVAFGTIGDASTSEGIFWETINAAAVLQVPLVMSIWDDGYGISVPKEFQTVKASISEALSGFVKTKDSANGIKIFRTKAWNYPDLIATYEEAVNYSREKHIPVLIHVEEVTQPQGHSTSGSHERYKSKERLEWAVEYDCNRQFRKFLLAEGAASEEELDEVEQTTKKEVKAAQKQAWRAYREDIDSDRNTVLNILNEWSNSSEAGEDLIKLAKELKSAMDPLRKEVISTLRKALKITRGEMSSPRSQALSFLQEQDEKNDDRYSSHLYSQSKHSPLKISEIAPTLSDEQADGRVILRDNFEALFKKYPELVTFGEDTGKIGGVNQVMEGMQDKFGPIRVGDTGIREATILGQGIGMAMRGLRPIAEIQYLDYLYYALQIMRDDLSTIRYRTKGKQMAPVIVRTRGHRLEGIWHSGSPMAAILNSIRGMHVCVPRNMVQAAGIYNTLLQGDDPALVIECLNGYRSKEPMPTNLGEFTVALGEAEVVKSGTDLTIVSYGSTFNLCVQAAQELSDLDIDVELVDVRTLLPFDRSAVIGSSIAKTSRVLFVDEDVPGGASAYMLERVLSEQSAYFRLDSEPKTLSARAHLPAYGSDGDYISKPSVDDIVEAAYAIISEVDPEAYPPIR